MDKYKGCQTLCPNSIMNATKFDTPGIEGTTKGMITASVFQIKEKSFSTVECFQKEY